MLLIREDLCDNSEECWFLKYCPDKVAKYEQGQVIIDGGQCKSCNKCEGRCQITAVATTEAEKEVVEKNLRQLPPRDMSLDVYGAEPINSKHVIYSPKEGGCSYEKAIELIKNNGNFLLIELLHKDSLICKVAGVYFDDIQRDASKAIGEKYNGEIEHVIIYAGDQLDVFKRFAEYFGIKDISKSPMIVLYQNNKVIGVYSHGLIHFRKYSSDEFQKDIRQMMENYNV